MSCYVSSRENRFLAALEQSYAVAADVNAARALPALGLSVSQVPERADRRDKTGSRTFPGLPANLRRETSFELTAYLTSWSPSDAEPPHDVLLQAGLGAAPLSFAGGTVDSITGTQLRFTAAHGLSVGQAISCGGEIRFVTAIVDTQTVVLNAPFTADQAAGWPVDRTVTYAPATQLPSATIFDYWTPAEAVQRILVGAAVNRIAVEINGDFHQFRFSGAAADLIDSASFTSGQAGLTSFPAEPAPQPLDYALVPGHLGQAWLGTNPDQFFTLTSAEVALDNNLDLRANEFGMSQPRCVAAGRREVTLDFSLYAKPDTQTTQLYQAARNRSPVSVMFQLGEQPSQLCGVYLKSVVLEVPEFLDDEVKLEWRFRDCRAQGAVDDEIFIAFG